MTAVAVESMLHDMLQKQLTIQKYIKIVQILRLLCKSSD